jgi:hypothetical protein
LPYWDSDVHWKGHIRSPEEEPVTDVLFKKVNFDDQVDPVRIEYTWWPEESDQRLRPGHALVGTCLGGRDRPGNVCR